MCGHVGMAGKLEFRDEITLKRMLILDYFRGPDSTGVAVIDKAIQKAKIAKMASHPLDLFDTPKYKAAVSGFASSVFMGHNRAATRGEVNAVNAHPFEYDHIIGCHNGTLSPSSFAALEEALDEKFNVDSQAIFAAIAKLGIKETMTMLQGAWALVWVDLNEGSLNFLRNKERPFWYAYGEKFDQLFWASEWQAIDAATKLSASPYKLYHEEKTFHQYWQTEEDVHLRYDIAALQKGGDTLTKPISVIRKGKEPAPVAVAAGQQNFPKIAGNGGCGTTSTTKSRSDEDRTLILQGTDAAPFAGYYTKEQFDQMAKYGCSWCNADVHFDEVGVTVMERDEIVLCPACSCASSSSRVYAQDLEAVKHVR